MAGLNAIALAVADEHALGAVMKFGCSATAHLNRRDRLL
jgi:hypothetical protein